MASDNFLAMENLQGFEGLSALEESAVRLHEIYKSLMTGGFTEDEALSLIAKMTKPNSESIFRFEFDFDKSIVKLLVN